MPSLYIGTANIRGMITCMIDGPAVLDRWKRICLLDVCEPGTDRLAPECPDWSERLIENSFLRQPQLLARVLGVDPSEDVLALKQVARIDLYLRSESGLHLLEVKKPTEHGEQWKAAASQIARQWVNECHWLRHGGEPVFLWAVCPVRWSKRRKALKVPDDWKPTLVRIRAEQLTGPAEASIGLLFYSIFTSAGRRRLFMWRADEPPPTVSVP